MDPASGVVDDGFHAQYSTATLGRTAGQVAANDEPAHVAVLALSRATALADQRDADTLFRLEGFDSGGGRRLEARAGFIVLRKFWRFDG